MKVIIVEDEEKNSARLIEELHRLNNMSTVKAFYDKDQAFQEILSLEPEMVFINRKIGMYDKWDFIHQVRQCIPKTLIILVDEDQKFILNPLNIHLLDYGLETVEGLKLNHTLHKYFEIQHKRNVTLHGFRVLHFTNGLSENPLKHTPWRTQKGKEIFAYLLHNRLKMVHKDTLLHMFWPENDSKSAMSQLYTTIFHIRKTIESMDFPIEILNMEQFYMLDLKGVTFDVDIFKSHFESRSSINEVTLPMYLNMIEMYAGDYFEIEDFTWAKTERYRMRMYWMTYIREVANYYTRKGNYTAAIVLYMQMQKRYPEYEESYEQLMKLFYEYGDRSSALEQYKALTNMLRQSFRTKPHKRIKDWIDSRVKETQK